MKGFYVNRWGRATIQKFMDRAGALAPARFSLWGSGMVKRKLSITAQIALGLGPGATADAILLAGASVPFIFQNCIINVNALAYVFNTPDPAKMDVSDENPTFQNNMNFFAKYK